MFRGEITPHPVRSDVWQPQSPARRAQLRPETFLAGACRHPAGKERHPAGIRAVPPFVPGKEAFQQRRELRANLGPRFDAVLAPVQEQVADDAIPFFI